MNREQILRQIAERTAMLQLFGHSAAVARKLATKEIASRERGRSAAPGTPPPDSTSGLPSRAHLELQQVLHRWIHHLWRRPKRKRSSRVIPGRNTAPEPTMTAAPLVIHEPAAPLTADPRLQAAFPAPLVVTGFQNARIIPNAEFPQRYIDRTTDNWRASIQHNEDLAKHRAQQSAAYRNRAGGSRYVG
jgi:hypothetical protein